MDEEQAFTQASWVNVGGNLFKLSIEGWIGLAFGSLSLVADAANSLGDVLAGLAVLLGGRFSFVGPDRDHPHGHERIEPLAALFAGAIIVVMGLSILVEAGTRLIEEPEGSFDVVLLVALVVAVALKLGQWWYTRRVNEDVDSTGLRALAADALSDMYATTAAVVGVLGIGIGLPILDPIAAAVVSVLILREGAGVVIENVRYLTGAAPPEPVRRQIQDITRSHPGVTDVREVKAHYLGPEFKVELEGKVPDDATVDETQNIESELIEDIDQLDDVHDVHIRFKPDGEQLSRGIATEFEE